MLAAHQEPGKYSVDHCSHQCDLHPVTSCRSLLAHFPTEVGPQLFNFLGLGALQEACCNCFRISATSVHEAHKSPRYISLIENKSRVYLAI